MCGVQRVSPIIFLNSGKYNDGLLKGLSPHTHTHILPIYQLKRSVYEKYVLNKNCCITFAKCASLKKISPKVCKRILCQQCHVKEYMQNNGAIANNRFSAGQIESITVCFN
jgi:diadenosine tetraphosphate (Ap4A) HIT family hydrolase